MNKKFLYTLFFISGITALQSCTKLNEEILDEASVAGLTDKQLAEGTIAPVYSVLPTIFQHTN